MHRQAEPAGPLVSMVLIAHFRIPLLSFFCRRSHFFLPPLSRMQIPKSPYIFLFFPLRNGMGSMVVVVVVVCLFPQFSGLHQCQQASALSMREGQDIFESKGGIHDQDQCTPNAITDYETADYHSEECGGRSSPHFSAKRHHRLTLIE